MQQPSLLEIAHKTLEPYSKNKNTGNDYEIAVILCILRQMGLTNEHLQSLNDLASKIAAFNSKKSEKINQLFKYILDEKVGNGTLLNSKIVNLINATQDDSAGTGDLILVTAENKKISISITGGIRKRNGTISKCLTNPCASRFGCTKDDILAFKEIENQTVPKYKDEMKQKYGDDEHKWNRKPSQAAKDACASVATKTVSRFASLDDQMKLQLIKNLLCITTESKPADYLALVHPKSYKVSFYRFDDCLIKEWNPILEASGIYIHIYASKEKEIAQVQVKFNNGVYHNGKTSAIDTSWNAVCNLTDLFAMSAVTN